MYKLISFRKNEGEFLKKLDYYIKLLNELIKQPESGYVEFKVNNIKPEGIGEYISALSNTVALLGRPHGYLVWGIDDKTHEVVGTTFSPKFEKVGNEELESWLLKLMNPRINFSFHEVSYRDKNVVILEVEKASNSPVKFYHNEYVRIGSYKKKLKDYPEKERELWRSFENIIFEEQIAVKNISDSDVLTLLDYPAYFELLDLPLPESRAQILETLSMDKMIKSNEIGSWNITNLGAILFAKKLSDFDKLSRKAVRVIIYKGKDKLETRREQVGNRGYASGFKGLMDFIDNFVPRNEVIGKALRKEVPMYPDLAVRELVVNALIHQDFTISGTSPVIEIFSDRMEIINPGVPLVNVDRFLDTPPRSRNEMLASFLRRAGICEERGSGVDKVVSQAESYQLPGPLFEITGQFTRATLFAHKELKQMLREEKMHACYLHACLKYVSRDTLTNSSLRIRFGLDDKSASVASRIIKDAVDDNRIKLLDPKASNKHKKYIPFWGS